MDIVFQDGDGGSAPAVVPFKFLTTGLKAEWYLNVEVIGLGGPDVLKELERRDRAPIEI